MKTFKGQSDEQDSCWDNDTISEGDEWKVESGYQEDQGLKFQALSPRYVMRSWTDMIFGVGNGVPKWEKVVDKNYLSDLSVGPDGFLVPWSNKAEPPHLSASMVAHRDRGGLVVSRNIRRYGTLNGVSRSPPY